MGVRIVRSLAVKMRVVSLSTLRYPIYLAVIQRVAGQNSRANYVVKQRTQFRSFFCLDAAWLNEDRCPGGRPSVS